MQEKSRFFRKFRKNFLLLFERSIPEYFLNCTEMCSGFIYHQLRSAYWKSVLFLGSIALMCFAAQFLMSQEDVSNPSTTLRAMGDSLDSSSTTPRSGDRGTLSQFLRTPRITLEESRIRVLLNDKNGELYATIPDLSIEEIEKILHRNRPQRIEPSYSIQRIDAEGKVENHFANIHIRISFTTRNEPTVVVPIAFHEGIFLLSGTKAGFPEDPPEIPASQSSYAGRGSCDLIVDNQTREYALLVKNPISEDSGTESGSEQSFSHTFSFSLSFPVATLGKEDQRLRLSFPPAVASRLVLSVPMEDAVPMDTQSMELRSIAPIPSGGTQFEMQRISQSAEISWRPQIKTEQISKPTALQVEGAKIFVRINPQEMQFDASLPVQSVGGPLHRFHVRLPQGTRYVPESPESGFVPEYQIREISEQQDVESSAENAGKESVNHAPILEITVQGSSRQEIRLRAVRPLSTEERPLFHELSGFDAIGAERQAGHIEIEIPDDMRLSWKSAHAIQLDDDSQSSVSDKKIVRFTYYSQPFSMQVRAVLPQTQISVKPEYQVEVEKEQLVLHGKISAMVRGAKTDHLQLHLFRWNLQEVASNGMFDISDISRDEEEKEGSRGKNTTTIPLLVRTDGPIELSFTATHPLPPLVENRSHIHFELPIPLADRIEPATITIIPADNVELPGNTQECIGFSRVSRIVSGFPAPIRQQEPLYFRTDIPLNSETSVLSFESEMILHQQAVYANSRADIRLMEKQDQVVQQLLYDVRFEPLSRIHLLIPKSIDENGSLKIFLEGKEIDYSRYSFPDSVDESVVRRRIVLPSPLIGTGSFIIRYSFEPMEAHKQMTTRANIPLIVPADAKLVEQLVITSVQSGVKIQSYSPLSEQDQEDVSPEKEIDFKIRKLKKPWKKVERGGSGIGNSGLLESCFSSENWETSIPLYVQLDYMDVLGTTVVERAWIQTLLTERVRVDRACFRITSDHESIPIYLPNGFEKNRVVVFWDNEQIPLQYDAEGALLISQKFSERSKPHLLDIKYQMAGESITNNLEIELLHFDPDVWIRKMYWQVILPQNRHILGDCSGWTPEFHWSWNKLFWKRESALSPEELEIWIGSSGEHGMNISQETSQYLFSSFNPPKTCELQVVNRTQIVLFCSGTTLLIGLGLIYFPWVRHVGVIFALSVLLVAVLLYHPSASLLILQSSILGVLLALISGILARIFHQDQKWKSIPTHSPGKYGGESNASSQGTPLEVIIDSSQKTHIIG